MNHTPQNDPPGQQPSPIQPAAPGALITLVPQQRSVSTYGIMDHELTVLSAPSGSANLTLFGIAVGILATALVTIITAAPVSPFVYASFAVSIPVMVLLSIFFGMYARREIKAARKVVDDIRKRPAQPAS